MGDKIDQEALNMFIDYMKKQPIIDKDKLKKKKRANNYSTAHYRLDLHGLTLPEALSAVEAKLMQLVHYPSQHLEIITGQGKHSPGIYSPLYEGVKEFLEKQQKRFNIDFTVSGGVFKIWQKKY